jgi:hypothetical protein
MGTKNKKKDKSKGKKKKFAGQVSLTRARKIFEALGYKTANNWSDVQLTKKIQKLPDLAEGAKLNTKMQKRVNIICNALKKGKKVVVVDLEDVAAGKKRAEDVEKAAKERTKEKKAKAKTKKGKKEAKTKTNSPKTPTTKDSVYALFCKVKPEKALSKAEQWHDKTGKVVKLSTIKGWISSWVKGKNLPRSAKNKIQ